MPGHEYLLTSTNLFELEDTPKNVAIIGSGYVGMEFATLLSAAGVKVTVIVRSGQPLEGFYSQHVHQLVDEMKNSLGINFIFKQNVTVTEAQTGYEVQSANGNLGTLIKLLMPVVEFLKLMH
ncbi:FAD-dependent oxidoreductase [Levilactobacillus brevis]|uniref:FAD-dependent oxidoreductase n=1 Tax=Levilactobacillus brevis TaxID=1580 RepID=UPI0022771F56|nr:FAD-dependent oxidoreductase [Levilactobacillus brevis]